MRLKHLLDAAVESLDHAIGLRVRRRCEAMLDPKVRAQLVKLVLAAGSALAQTEQSVGELFAITPSECR